MAAPAEATIQNLDGLWTMDYDLSADLDPILVLQGINWFVRKAISMATVTLDISQTVDAEDGKVHVDITQTLTGGLQGTSEHRVLDWQTRLHSDHIFGNLEGKSHLIGGVPDANGKARPAIEIQTSVADEQIVQFLNGEINSDGTPSDGWLVDPVDTEKPGVDDVDPAHGLWLQSWVKSLDVGYEWSAEQIWGFEEIQGERRYTRRLALASKEGQFILARFVYSYLGPRPTPDPAEDEFFPE